MTIFVDMTYNYRFWPNTRPAVVSLPRNAGTAAVPLQNTYKDEVKGEDYRALELVQDSAEAAFLVPNIQLNPTGTEGRRIRRNDVITDADAVVWSVVTASEIEHGCAWRCLVRRAGG